MSKPKISTYSKFLIVKLAKAGISSTVLASVFGVPTQAVAAYQAWDTMRQK
jgi:hypothetical protein